jgi:2-amino-4-hydroxy-6-hydroxymethyldihydropteridine diphosphokinase
VKFTAYIGFGSNLGDLLHNFYVAQDHLCATAQTQVSRISKLYSSEPLAPKGDVQPWYLNAVFELKTDLSPHELFDRLKKIEQLMGRKSHRKWASRIIDLDLLFFQDLIFSDQILSVPHRQIENRRFVLMPLCDLIPNFSHPEFELTLQELLAECQDPLQVNNFESSDLQSLNLRLNPFSTSERRESL